MTRILFIRNNALKDLNLLNLILNPRQRIELLFADIDSNCELIQIVSPGRGRLELLDRIAVDRALMFGLNLRLTKKQEVVPNIFQPFELDRWKVTMLLEELLHRLDVFIGDSPQPRLKKNKIKQLEVMDSGEEFDITTAVSSVHVYFRTGTNVRVETGKRLGDQVMFFPESFRCVIQTLMDQVVRERFQFSIGRGLTVVFRWVQKYVSANGTVANIESVCHHLSRYFALTKMMWVGLCGARFQIWTGIESKKLFRVYQYLGLDVVCVDLQERVYDGIA